MAPRTADCSAVSSGAGAVRSGGFVGPPAAPCRPGDPLEPGGKRLQQHFAKSSLIVSAGELAEREKIAGKRRQIAQDIARHLQLRQRPGAGIDDLHYDADPFPLRERHANQAPDIGRRCRLSYIVEQPMQRQVKCDAKDWHGRLPGVLDKPVGNPGLVSGPANLWITLWIAFG